MKLNTEFIITMGTWGLLLFVLLYLTSVIEGPALIFLSVSTLMFVISGILVMYNLLNKLEMQNARY